MSETTYQVPAHIGSLLETYSEMMTGDKSPETVELALQYALYMAIRGHMPPLVQHWNGLNPEASEQVKAAVQQLQAMNKEWNEKRKALKEQAQAGSQSQE